MTTPYEDHLEDLILLGLRRLFGKKLVDYPKKEVMYENAAVDDADLYGNGFTIWKKLEDIDVSRDGAFEQLREGEFDIVIFGSIQNQRPIFRKFIERSLFDLPNTEFIFLDGQDYNPFLHVTRGPLQNRRYTKKGFDSITYTERNCLRLFKDSIQTPVVKPALEEGTYFKRELGRRTYNKFGSSNLLPISLCIPEEKLQRDFIEKEKRFVEHIELDEAYKIDEVAENSTKSPPFSEEESYFEDLRRSRFAILSQSYQRKPLTWGGWERFKIYEVMASRCIPCLYRFYDKPAICGPYGLQDMENAIFFRDYAELENKIDHVLQNDMYRQMNENLAQMNGDNTCKERAREILFKAVGYSETT